jgi:hypothetical protein
MHRLIMELFTNAAPKSDETKDNSQGGTTSVMSKELQRSVREWSMETVNLGKLG